MDQTEVIQLMTIKSSKQIVMYCLINFKMGVIIFKKENKLLIFFFIYIG